MVDIETTGTDPSHAAIIQIAAVAFDLREKTIVTDRMFDRCLIPPQNRFWDQSTRTWWENQPHVLERIVNRMEDASTVMFDFHRWLLDFGDVTLWAKPTSFESPFLESYFRQHGLANPFAYWRSVDLNSFIEGRGHNRREFWDRIEFQGDKHDAIFDVIHQITGAFHA